MMIGKNLKGSGETVKPESAINRILGALAILAGLGLYGFHLFKIWVFSVDVPFWDDWRSVPPNATWAWVTKQEAEHKPVVAKLLYLLTWKLNGWDISFQQVLNFLTFGVAIVLLGWVIKKWAPTIPTWLVAVLCALTLSPRASECHHWASNTVYYVSQLLYFSAVAFLFTVPREGRQSNWSIGAGITCGFLAIFTFGMAVPEMLVVFLGFGAFKIIRSRWPENNKLLELRQLGVVAGLIVLGMGLYRWGYETPAQHKTLILPTTKPYWDYFSTLIAFGWGFRWGQIADYAILIGLSLVIGVAMWRLCSSSPREELAGNIGLVVTFWGVVGALGATTLGRANFGVEQALSGRYAVVSMMLIPLGGAILWQAFQLVPKARVALVGAYLCVGCLGFGLTWPYINDYEVTYLVRRNEARHLTFCYARRIPCKVPNLSAGPVEPELLDKALEAKMSFMKKVVSGRWD